jgi:hypothetical protein
MIMFGKYIPSIDQTIIDETRSIMAESYLKEDDWKDTIYTYVHLKSMIKSRFFDIFREAELGGKLPDGDVITSNFLKKRLIDYSTKDRPLVLNFGSCT